MAPPKPVHTSKTVWVNTLTTVAGVLAATQGLIPPPALPWVLAASGLVNIALRFLTVQPIKIGAPR